MSEEWRLELGETYIKVSKRIERFSDGKPVYVDVETIDYDKFRDVNISVTRIEYEDMAVVIYASEFKFVDV